MCHCVPSVDPCHCATLPPTGVDVELLATPDKSVFSRGKKDRKWFLRKWKTKKKKHSKMPTCTVFDIPFHITAVYTSHSLPITWVWMYECVCVWGSSSVLIYWSQRSVLHIVLGIVSELYYKRIQPGMLGSICHWIAICMTDRNRKTSQTSLCYATSHKATNALIWQTPNPDNSYLKQRHKLSQRDILGLMGLGPQTHKW